MTKLDKMTPTRSVGLPALLHAVLSTGQRQEMSEEDKAIFHSRFAESMATWVYEHRAEQRRAYAALRKLGM